MALVTFTVTVHEPFAGTVAPLIETPVPLFVAVSAPPHVVAPPATAALTRPAGYMSLKATPVTEEALPLVSVIVSRLVSFAPMDDGTNDSLEVRPASTVREPLTAAALAPALPVVMPPAGIVFA